MPLNEEQKKQLKKEIEDYVVGRCRTEKGVDVGVSQSISDIDHLLKSRIIRDLNTKYSNIWGSDWERLFSEDTIAAIWATQGLSDVSEELIERIVAPVLDPLEILLGDWERVGDDSVSALLKVEIGFGENELLVRWQVPANGGESQTVIGMLQLESDATPETLETDGTTTEQRILARGMCLVEVGDFNFYRLIDEVERDENGDILRRTLRLETDKDAKAKPIHSIASIDYTSSENVVAQILDKDKNKIGPELRRMV